MKGQQQNQDMQPRKESQCHPSLHFLLQRLPSASKNDICTVCLCLSVSLDGSLDVSIDILKVVCFDVCLDVFMYLCMTVLFDCLGCFQDIRY